MSEIAGGKWTMNVLADLILGARRSRSMLADGGCTLSDSAFVSEARSRAFDIGRLASRGEPLVAVCLPLSAECVIQLLGSILADHSICYLDPAAGVGYRNSILQAIEPDVVVDNTGMRKWNGQGKDDRSHPPGYVAMSSGSTGSSPKGVLSEWASIAAFVPHGASALELDESSIWAEMTHPAYDMAMTNLLLALAVGASVRVSSTLGDRLRPLRFVERVGATHMRVAPRFIDLARSERRAGGSLSLRVWGSGGDRLSVRGVRQVLSFGVPLIVNTYGTSETSGFASAARVMADEDVPSFRGIISIGSGSVGAWQTTLVERDQQAMLSIRSPHLPSGYLFGGGDAYPRWEGREAVVTGDVGFQDGGRLYCLGRSGRRVKRNGRFVDLDEIDTLILNSRGRLALTFGTAEGDLITLVETAEGDLGSLRSSLTSVLRPELLPDEMIAIKQFPRLGNGKIDQAASRSLVDGAR